MHQRALHSIKAWVIVVGILLITSQVACADIFSTELYGQGDADVAALMTTWSDAYRATRDDISLVYDVASAEDALETILAGKSDFINLDSPVHSNDADSVEQYGSMFQVPISAQGVAFTYNLAATVDPTSDPPLVLDLPTLAAVFMGDVVLWSDARIAQLNPQLAQANKLPAINITLAFIPGDGLDLSEPLKRALPLYDAALAQAIDDAQGDFAGLPPALAGRWVSIHDQAERLAFVGSTEGAMTYLGSADALRAKLVCAQLVNKANETVALSTASVAAAVADFAADLAEDAQIDILDAPGNASYPLAYVSFLSIRSNVSTEDCTPVVNLLTFLSWTQTNQRALDILEELNYTSLGDGGRKRLIDTLSEVECNGEQVFDLAILIGVGAPLGEFAIWATDYSSNDDDDKLHYYWASSEDVIAEVENKQIDFGVVAAGANVSFGEHTTVLPSMALGLVPAYNVPALDGTYLVLSLEVLGGIYLGSVARWSDYRIIALNPHLPDGLLPDAPIRVLLMSEPSDITYVFSSAMDQAVDGWHDAVGVGELLSFPAATTSNWTINVTAVTLMPTLQSTPNAIAIWTPLQAIASRSVQMARMLNAEGSKVVKISQESVQAAVDSGFDMASTQQKRDATDEPLLFPPILLAPGEESWPMVAWASLLLHVDQDNCYKLRGLVEFVWWIQTDEVPEADLKRTMGVRASETESVKHYIYDQLKQFRCDGAYMVPFQNCLTNGTVCSDMGTCSEELGTCICDDGRTGTHCEFVASSSTADQLALGLGIGLPLGLGVLLVVLCLLVAVALLARRRRETDEWEVDLEHEVELGQLLGTGGFGEVFRATWKGTEVAVKRMAANGERVTKDMEKSFRDEVRVMTALRHPNVVLFMGACTKAPKMCIIMEFMGLGSLYELLHNELVPEIPAELKYKMAYQAAKGMHFLHSSGIVHRDLKSLNLLLDNKWNLKVSDFGLTKFKEDLKRGHLQTQQQVQGSIHWTAPEILNEVDSVDYVLADVYSFGIVLWEMLTRAQPYQGLSPAAVAVAVIRDGLRPGIPDELRQSDFAELITTCWHPDPSIRPTFLEIMTRLSAMLGESSSGFAYTRTSTSSSSSLSSPSSAAGLSFHVDKVDRIMGGEPDLASSTSTSTASSTGSRHSLEDHLQHLPRGGFGLARAPPAEDVTIVFTDIARAASLWEFSPRAMRDATLLHNELLRDLLQAHRGYEASFTRERNSGEGSFCMAFWTVHDALAWCTDAQNRLLRVEWPIALLDHPGAAEEWGGTDDRVLFKGLRVRMGVNVGAARTVKDPMSRRMEYMGPMVNAAARITAMTHGGQVLLSQAALDRFNTEAVASSSAQRSEERVFTCLGRFEVPDQQAGSKLYEYKVDGLEARFFGGVAPAPRRAHDGDDNSSSNDRSEEDSQTSGPSSLSFDDLDGGGRAAAGDSSSLAMAFKEDNFLTSANLCRWIIDFNDIQLGKQVGLGSYGVVYRGRWKGVDVAVKRFIKQKLDERHMLEFRAEMAFLSELHHPNIVLFVGACVKRPNLCLVTEFVARGSLRELLHDTSAVPRLEWHQRMRMLRGAALGIAYLHGLEPAIIHRDLKSSNLLVDDEWNVKVADFGLARIKEENATMTRCGTPAWTAPEVIRGESYSERADVYSFAVVMWEVVTRKEPFAGRNFMGVSLDVLEGKRPQVPNDCPKPLAKLMAKCWHDKPDKRPSMADVLATLDRLAGDPTSSDGGVDLPMALP